MIATMLLVTMPDPKRAADSELGNIDRFSSFKTLLEAVSAKLSFI
jgi:hypothetical protein